MSEPNKPTTVPSVDDIVRRSRREAADEARDTIRRLMADCKGSEWQRLNTFNHMLTIELSRIMDRMEELRPDEWGM